MAKSVLTSWKEIAEYLGCSARTVQRWEQHYGLPIHRPAGKLRSAVVALPSEIDIWAVKAPRKLTTQLHPAHAGARPKTVRGSQRRPVTLLCIDDHEGGLAVRKAFLEVLGYHVLTACDGPNGLKLLADNAVDLVVIDYRMEGLNGAEVARIIRQRKPDVPILMLAGDIRDVPEGALLVVDEFVQKGLPSSVFLTAIEKLLQQTGREIATDSGQYIRTSLPPGERRSPTATPRGHAPRGPRMHGTEH